MPVETAIERRDRALIAFTILTGARDGAIASLKLKHRQKSPGTGRTGSPNQGFEILSDHLLPGRGRRSRHRRGLDRLSPNREAIRL
jgi:hypothetical protein